MTLINLDSDYLKVHAILTEVFHKRFRLENMGSNQRGIMDGASLYQVKEAMEALDRLYRRTAP